MAAAVTAVAGRDEMAPVGAEKRIFRWQMKLMQKELKSVNSEEQVSLRHPVCLQVAVGCGSGKFLFHAFLSSQPRQGQELGAHTLFSLFPRMSGEDDRALCLLLKALLGIWRHCRLLLRQAVQQLSQPLSVPHPCWHGPLRPRTFFKKTRRTPTVNAEDLHRPEGT